MNHEFSDLERLIINYLKDSEVENPKTKKLERVALVGKPTCEKGEPKTDVYVRLIDKLEKIEELKISVKKDNADFLENKTNAQRAEEILGKNWEQIIENSTLQLKNEFEGKDLVFFDKYGKTDAGSFTLGWKFEILNKKSGELSGLIPLTHDQKLDVLSGKNLPLDKKNAKVNNQEIIESGVANYILTINNKDINSVEDIMKNLVRIEDYVDTVDLFFACKALNYRSLYRKGNHIGKYDGNRPLAVFVNWFANNGKLKSNLVFNEPLEHGGDYTYEKLKKAIEELGAENTNDLDESQVESNYYKEDKKND